MKKTIVQVSLILALLSPVHNTSAASREDENPMIEYEKREKRNNETYVLRDIYAKEYGFLNLDEVAAADDIIAYAKKILKPQHFIEFFLRIMALREPEHKENFDFLLIELSRSPLGTEQPDSKILDLRNICMYNTCFLSPEEAKLTDKILKDIRTHLPLHLFIRFLIKTMVHINIAAQYLTKVQFKGPYLSELNKNG